MKQIKKTFSNTRIGMVLSVLLMCLQSLADMTNVMPLNDSQKVYVVPTIMLLIFVVDALNKYFNLYISNKSLWFTLILFIGYLGGGLYDYLSPFNFSDIFLQWARFGLSFLVMIQSVLSETLFANKLNDVKNDNNI